MIDFEILFSEIYNFSRFCFGQNELLTLSEQFVLTLQPSIFKIHVIIGRKPQNPQFSIYLLSFSCPNERDRTKYLCVDTFNMFNIQEVIT